MRYLLLVNLLALPLLSVVGATDAYASRYCLQGAHWGFPGSCHFSTYSQCQASASGTNAHCGINPRYAHQRHGQGH